MCFVDTQKCAFKFSMTVVLVEQSRAVLIYFLVYLSLTFVISK